MPAVTYAPIPGLTPGAGYVFASRVYVPSGSPDVQAVVAGIVSSTPVTARDQWVPVTVAFNAPADGSPVTLGFESPVTPPANAFCYVDDVSLQAAAVPAYFDGDTATDPQVGWTQWDGTVGQSSSSFMAPVRALLAGPVFQPQGHVITDWTLAALDAAHAPVTVWVGAVSDDGSTVLDQKGPYQIGATQTVLRWEVDQSPNSPWRPAVWVMGAGVTFTLATWSAETLSPEECVAPYRRTFSQVTTVDGPNVTGQEVTDCGERFLYVEWTWVAGNPYRFGTPVTLSAGATSSQGPTSQRTGVVTTPMGTISATPYNCAQRTEPASCVNDPCYIGFTAPPPAPVIPDAKRPNITTQQVKAVSVWVPSEQIPNAEGVFSFILGNDGSDKVGVRVRVYPGVPTSAGPSDLCDFAYEYNIDYIAPEAIFTIDGVTGTGRVLCDGDTVEQDASSVVRGSFGGPPQDPVAGCDQDYYVIVQWLATYPWTCSGAYTQGQDQGQMTVALTAAPREG